MLQYLLFRFISLVAPLVPPGVGYWVCDWLGDIFHRLLAQQRRTVACHLSIILRERVDDLDRRVREVFRQGARYYYDTFRMRGLSDAELEMLISLEGWDNLIRALDRGNGAIVFTGHLGSPALVAQILGVRGQRVTTPAEPIRPRRLFDLMARARGGRGIRLIPLGPTTTRELTEALRRNEIVGVVVDRDVPKTGVQVDFFGIQTTLPAGPVTLALRTKAALVPGFAYRRENGRFAAIIGEPVELERTGDLREDVRLNAQKVARVLERAIARAPEQWVVFEPVWPDGMAGICMGVAG